VNEQLVVTIWEPVCLHGPAKNGVEGQLNPRSITRSLAGRLGVWGVVRNCQDHELFL
jgi:hypothetical protein